MPRLASSSALLGMALLLGERRRRTMAMGLPCFASSEE